MIFPFKNIFYIFVKIYHILKHLTYLLFLCPFLVSCGPTSNIITSKAEAEKRGIYRSPQNKSVAKTTPTRNASTKPTSRNVTAKKNTTGSTNSKINDRNADDYETSGDNASYVVKQLINAAEANLGVGYRTGGTNPNTGFDCSGLMFSTFQKFDITLPRSSNDMSKVGRKLDDDEIQKGDLIFFKTNGRSVINHVGMVTEVTDDEIKFIHSSTQKGVIISSTKEPYYGRTYAQANRIIVNL
ncbi:Cell wall-associated hydrolase, NlpC family [Flavobacterium caeni]|uniref:Cell wall-associated hydrolase, NlpC family n=1 Tax=Flavobacterium caeni TaxID=490189 RepID=A0A1G5GJA2_9FLAO|nr:Cell wall-associated hydrolase, NlpC family [Flavobacterium caeni]